MKSKSESKSASIVESEDESVGDDDIFEDNEENFVENTNRVSPLIPNPDLPISHCFILKESTLPIARKPDCVSHPRGNDGNIEKGESSHSGVGAESLEKK